MNTSQSPKLLRHRRFMTMLPALVLPFLIILFVLLGGGKDTSANASIQTGLNTNLPEANLEKKSLADKLRYYESADKDSADIASLLKYDPYAQHKVTLSGDANRLTPQDPGLRANRYSDEATLSEEKIYEKIEQLNKAINQTDPVGPSAVESPKPASLPKPDAAIQSADLERLQQMMQQMQSGNQADPELLQLQSLLEKIQEIQHPELVANKLSGTTQKPSGVIYQTIPAVIAKNQKVTQGTVVELRLLDSVTLNGKLIPKGHQIYGTASLSNQRMELRIKNIGLGQAIIPVDLTIFDQRDSMEGIYLPEAITGEAIRGGTDNALQGLQVLTMDQSVGTQIAGAGITAAKGLFSKKVRLLKGKISAGYPVLIRNNQN